MRGKEPSSSIISFKTQKIHRTTINIPNTTCASKSSKKHQFHATNPTSCHLLPSALPCLSVYRRFAQFRPVMISQCEALMCANTTCWWLNTSLYHLSCYKWCPGQVRSSLVLASSCILDHHFLKDPDDIWWYDIIVWIEVESKTSAPPSPPARFRSWT